MFCAIALNGVFVDNRIFFPALPYALARLALCLLKVVILFRLVAFLFMGKFKALLNQSVVYARNSERSCVSLGMTFLLTAFGR